MLLKRVRDSLLKEGRNSPALLADLAGLEQYVAESYDARSFVELLQNADDAGASRFIVQNSGGLLLVANDGHEFTEQEFESLCRSAASTKHRGNSIGYRGIGFKSVVGLAHAVHLLSGELAATFSRARTAVEIPQALHVPLIRIPHPLENADDLKFRAASKELAEQGYKTIFIFEGLIARAIEGEFAAFNPTSLLFLRNIRTVELQTGSAAPVTVRKQPGDASASSFSLLTNTGVTHWSTFQRSGVTFAFIRDNLGIKRLDENDAVVHAFLPTHESTGFPFKIDADFSTDPSRTRIVLDERTSANIEIAARFIVELLSAALAGSSESGLLEAIAPISDPRLVRFQRRSFRTELLAAVQRAAGNCLENLYCRPSWLNAKDFGLLAARSDLKILNSGTEEIAGLGEFLRTLGARETLLSEISMSLTDTEPSMIGAAEIVAHLSMLYATRQIERRSLSPYWKIWQVGDRITSLDQAAHDASGLLPQFVAKVEGLCGSIAECRNLLTAMTDQTNVEKLLQIKRPSGGSPSDKASLISQRPMPLSLKRWRSAEEQVVGLLSGCGWKVEDVSRQNIGYDLEARTPEGEPAFIEVKVIERPGEAFTLTTNEEAVARQKGKAYRLAVVRQTGKWLEVAFIADPAHALKLTRQCRQWVWECSAYDYDPDRFPLE